MQGVYPVVATPFTTDSEVDFPSLRNEIARLGASGCHGVVLFGFASEFYKLSDDEKREMIRVAVEASDDADVPLYVSITQHATEIAVQWARDAEQAGVDGLMLLPPFMMGPSESDLREHVKRVGEAVSLPILVQYAPDNTGVTIEPDVFAQLSADVENVEAYKIECSPPGGYIEALLEATDGGVDVMVGNAGRQMIDTFDRGAVGVMPGGSLHEVYVQIYERYVGGDRDEAVAIHRDLIPLLNSMGQTGEMFIHYEKQLLHRRGMIETGVCRQPAFDPDEQYDRLVDEAYEELRPYLDE